VPPDAALIAPPSLAAGVGLVLRGVASVAAPFPGQPPGFWSVHWKKNSAGPFGPVRSWLHTVLNCAMAAIPASMVLTFPDRPLMLLASLARALA
jgi:hypothetical protein